ncbi:MAG: hypothetical protein D6678_06785 [Zetaproteobacteria bacterium]|nr:MAG: hypothetical protein D6678_06785 [Zetaproteobacteria bacterium]
MPCPRAKKAAKRWPEPQTFCYARRMIIAFANRSYRHTLGLLSTLMLGVSAAWAGGEMNLAAWRLPPVSYPKDNPYSEAKAELGKVLFFDPRINREGVSCAQCHHPGMNWSNDQARAQIAGQILPRHTPSLINVAYNRSFFWDGRADTLEDCIKQHFNGMDISPDARDTVARIRLIKGYAPLFRKAFGKEAITEDTIAKALATFVRGITVTDTPFDRWVQGDEHAISDSAKRGFALFTGKAGCVKCHAPPFFSDFAFHQTGTNSIDPGRAEVTGRKEDRNAFRTPQLRQVAETAPYMHTGQKNSLAEVLRFYQNGGDVRGQSLQLRAFDLSEQESRDLIAFLRALSGPPIRIQVPILPRAY